jgi:hypothetical protein
MSSMERLRELQNPRSKKNWNGASRDQANINRWSGRASENSDGRKHRAKSGEIELPNTNVELHSTAAPPRRDRKVDAHMAGKRDQNFVGSSDYMPGVRRYTS